MKFGLGVGEICFRDESNGSCFFDVQGVTQEGEQFTVAEYCEC